MINNKILKLRTRAYNKNINEKSNWLRAAVLGSNDGVISIAGLVIGVIRAARSKDEVIAAGLAGIVAGGISIAVGEYLSVSSSRDIENSLLNQEKIDLVNHPAKELKDLISAYKAEGMDPGIAEIVAKELTACNAFEVHASVDFNIDIKHLTNPWASVLASAGSFVAGASIPLMVAILSPARFALPSIFIAVLVTLTSSGFASAKFSQVSPIKPILRVVVGGALAMLATFLIGGLIKTAGI